MGDITRAVFNFGQGRPNWFLRRAEERAYNHYTLHERARKQEYEKAFKELAELMSCDPETPVEELIADVLKSIRRFDKYQKMRLKNIKLLMRKARLLEDAIGIVQKQLAAEAETSRGARAIAQMIDL